MIFPPERRPHPPAREIAPGAGRGRDGRYDIMELDVAYDIMEANGRTCTWTRYPSNLISCSQFGPDGGLSASAGWHGRMKPGGLERVSDWSRKRQSIHSKVGKGQGRASALRRKRARMTRWRLLLRHGGWRANKDRCLRQRVSSMENKSRAEKTHYEGPAARSRSS
jgi:hypothetical protein